MCISSNPSNATRQDSTFDTFAKQLSGKSSNAQGSSEGSGDQSAKACSTPFGNTGRNDSTGKETLVCGTPSPIPVEPDGGIGDGAGPIPVDTGGSTVTTLAIGEEDGSDVPHNDPNSIIGTRGDDTLTGTDDNDTIRGRKGDDLISVTGSGDKKINGGKGHDTLELKGLESDYGIRSRANGSTVYTAADGSRIIARNIEAVRFTGVTPPEPHTNPGFTVFYGLAPNDLGLTFLDITDGKAVLTGPDTDFTFTGIDTSALAFDGPIIATAGSGTINGEKTKALPLSSSIPAVLTIGSGFGGNQPVSATFANGDTLNTSVEAIAQS